MKNQIKILTKGFVSLFISHTYIFDCHQNTDMHVPQIPI